MSSNREPPLQETAKIYAKIYGGAGLERKARRGLRPAVLAADFTYGLCGATYPTAAETTPQLSATKRLCPRKRRRCCAVRL